MTIHDTLDLTVFRVAFPAFASSTTYPDIMVNAYYAAAGNYISQEDTWDGLKDSMLDYALQLVTAHLITVGQMAVSGEISGTLLSSSVDNVSINLAPPPVKTGLQYWLSSTPYGQQLWAMLHINSVGGWTIGGSMETSALRKAGGVF